MVDAVKIEDGLAAKLNQAGAHPRGQKLRWTQNEQGLVLPINDDNKYKIIAFANSKEMPGFSRASNATNNLDDEIIAIIRRVDTTTGILKLTSEAEAQHLSQLLDSHLEKNEQFKKDAIIKKNETQLSRRSSMKDSAPASFSEASWVADRLNKTYMQGGESRWQATDKGLVCTASVSDSGQLPLTINQIPENIRMSISKQAGIKAVSYFITPKEVGGIAADMGYRPQNQLASLFFKQAASRSVSPESSASVSPSPPASPKAYDPLPPLASAKIVQPRAPTTPPPVSNSRRGDVDQKRNKFKSHTAPTYLPEPPSPTSAPLTPTPPESPQKESTRGTYTGRKFRGA
jgi:hypothetical protein